MQWHLATGTFALVAVAAASTTAQQPAGDAQVARLIAQLSDEDNAAREAAAASLLRLGAAALPAVEDAAQSVDPETRFRSGRLLVRLRQRCFEEEITAFVRGRDSRATLAGWLEFQELTRDDGASRRVFAELYQTDVALMRAAFAETGDDAPPAIPPMAPVETRLGRMIERRAVVLQSYSAGRFHRKQAGVDPVAATLAVEFVAACRPGMVTPRASQLLTQVARSELAPVAKREDDLARATRRVLTRWACVNPSQDLYVLSQTIKLIDELNLREATPLAVEIALGKRTVRPSHPQFRATALLAVGKLGDASHVASLAPLLSDSSVCASQAGHAGAQAALLDVEVRDVALAVMLHLAGESPADYGFDNAVEHADRLFVLHTLAFRNAGSRGEALARWRDSPAGRDATLRIAQDAARPDENLLVR